VWCGSESGTSLKSVNPSSENGEFPTLVHAVRFTEPIACETGEVVERDGFVCCDVLP
jgi:hypothetical protein